MSTQTDSKRIRNKKRILSVTIRRMIDESPDTSWLGEYSNRPANEFAIDRAHSEDCETQTPEINLDGEYSTWNGSAKDALDRIAYQLETPEPCPLHSLPQELFCSNCRWVTNAEEAYETIRDMGENAGECDCHGGDTGRGEFRYFNPGTVEPFKPDATWIPATITNAADRKAYWHKAMLENAKKDYERMESLNAGNWCFVGIRAEAEVELTGDLTQDIRSGGLWGIESDSDRSYLESVQQDELANLKSELLALGFSKRAIATAFKDVKEQDA